MGMSAEQFPNSSARISARPQTHEPAENKQDVQGGNEEEEREAVNKEDSWDLMP